METKVLQAGAEEHLAAIAKDSAARRIAAFVTAGAAAAAAIALIISLAVLVPQAKGTLAAADETLRQAETAIASLEAAAADLEEADIPAMAKRIESLAGEAEETLTAVAGGVETALADVVYC